MHHRNGVVVCGTFAEVYLRRAVVLQSWTSRSTFRYFDSKLVLACLPVHGFSLKRMGVAEKSLLITEMRASSSLLEGHGGECEFE